MASSPTTDRVVLPEGGTVAVVGGGPAGAFFAIHLLTRARELGKRVRVIVLERRWQQALPKVPSSQACRWRGCNYCAGGISPKMSDVLREMNLILPPQVIQGRFSSIIVEGYWKNIELEIPSGREMFSVYRGSCPARGANHHDSFDAFLLEEARKAGAELVGGEAEQAQRAKGDRLALRYRSRGAVTIESVDFLVVAVGMNEVIAHQAGDTPMLRSLQGLIPGFVPPRVRRALICELEGETALPEHLAGTIHFLDHTSETLNLEMCSLVPKQGFLTAVLVGASVDAATGGSQHTEIVNRFLDLPQLRKLLSPGTRLHSVCTCCPNMVVGSARNPFADRVASVGDLVTTRLYKDGILSAQRTAQALAEAVLTLGIDKRSLDEGYGPTLRHFRRDNRFASVVFMLHRIFFSSSVLSRVIYQAVITERKTKSSADRELESILWQIASGDADYERILRAMLRPATVWSVFSGGLIVTLRNYLTEVLFGLRWEGFGRFTTGVAKEKVEAKRAAFARLLAERDIAVARKPEFERVYTIQIHAPAARILRQLGQFGEPDRGYLRPRWVCIRRVAGLPNSAGCVIRYEILGRLLTFNMVLEQVGERLAVYRVLDGFARGGVLVFEIEKLAPSNCNLSIYVAFDFYRGNRGASKAAGSLFRWLFPAFVHDVLWNHSLCQFKDLVEQELTPA